MRQEETKSIFRAEALAQLAAGTEKVHSESIVSSSDWMLLIGLVCVLCGIVGWGFFGSVTLNLVGQGIIVADSQLQAADALLQQMQADHKRKFLMQQVLLQKKHALLAKHLLTASDYVAATEEYLSAKERLMNPNQVTVWTAERFKNALDANASLLVFLPHREVRRVHIGMPVDIMPEDYSIFSRHSLSGTVVSVTPYPVSKQYVYAYLGNKDLIDEFFATGAPIMLRVSLQSAAYPGTLVQARIHYKTSTPLHLLLETNLCQDCL